MKSISAAMIVACGTLLLLAPTDPSGFKLTLPAFGVLGIGLWAWWREMSKP